MGDERGTIDRFAEGLGRALSSFGDLLAPDNLPRLFIELGLDQSITVGSDAAFLQKIGDAGTQAVALADGVDDLVAAVEADDTSLLIQQVTKVAEAIAHLAQDFDAIATDLNRLAAGSPNATAIGEFALEFAERALGDALLRYLDAWHPTVAATLCLLGLAEETPLDVPLPPVDPHDQSDDTPPLFLRRQLHLDRLGLLLRDPLALFQTAYGWGSESFDGRVLFKRIADFFAEIGPLATVDEGLSDYGAPEGDLPNDSPPLPPVLELFAVSFLPTTDAHPPGIDATLHVDLGEGSDITLGTFGDFRVAVQIASAVAAGLRARILPPASVTVTSEAKVEGEASLALLGQATDPTAPLLIFGETGGSRLQAKNVRAALIADVLWNAENNEATAEIRFEGKITDGKLIIDLSHADGFLAAVLPSDGFQLDFSLVAGWSTLRGFYLEGGAALEIVLPLHARLGPVTLELLYLNLGVAADGLACSTSIAASVRLGPITATIDRVGVTSQLAFKRGNLGPLDFGIGFKPPNGLGLSIDAGVVVGGGFISFDSANGRYAGVLDVELAETIQVKVIGLLDTILPDGSSGYSLLLIVTFAMPPIQLGFGFTLNGVGGLFGANRTMSVDALRAGLRAHTLNSVLFPPDPIANAPQIISNVRSFFPPADGRFVFGPMLELGWGTPTLITMAIGLILEVPDPVRLAIIGLIDAGLPSTDAALVQLHIDVLGTIDFAARKLAIDGSLFDSSVLIYALSGDLAMRLTWGSDPNFLFSLGGFNPHFNTAGLDLPPLKRMTVSIGDGDNPRISSNSYLAITSNTLQFGANNEAYASAGGFSVHGYLGFDVLIVYSPFSFTFDFKASFDVAVDGLTLTSFDIDGTFSGPRPWHLHAHVSIHLLFFDIGASMTLEWGDSTPVALPLRAVLPDLIPALQDARNWSTQLPDGARQAVSLLSPKPQEAVLRVHPMGTLTVRETVVPLDLPITRYAAGMPADGSLFAIGDVQINNNEEAAQTFQDYFATAQFLTLSDADKLSKPSFERFGAGVTIGSAGIESGAPVPRTVRYEERIIDVDSGFSRFTRIYLMAADLQAALSRQGAGTQSAVKNGGMAKYQNGPPAAAITSGDPGYVVAGVEDLAVRADISSAGGTAYFQAQAALATHLALHPEDKGQLQIVPLHEVAA